MSPRRAPLKFALLLSGALAACGGGGAGPVADGQDAAAVAEGTSPDPAGGRTRGMPGQTTPIAGQGGGAGGAGGGTGGSGGTGGNAGGGPGSGGGAGGKGGAGGGAQQGGSGGSAPRDGGVDPTKDAAPPPDATKPPPDAAPGSRWVGQPLVVVVGYGGRHLVSADGITWTDDRQDAPADEVDGKAFNDVAYGDGLVVAVGGGCAGGCATRIATFDGATWSDVALPVEQRAGWLAGVTYARGTWVAVGSAALSGALSSPDGRKWSGAGTPVPGNLRAVAYGDLGGKATFLAVGDKAGRARSADGSVWTDYATGFADAQGGDPLLLGLAIGGGAAVAVGEDGAHMRSADGKEWTHQTRIGKRPTTVLYVDGKFMAYDGNGASTSTDGGRSWTPTPTTNGPGSTVATAVFRGTRLFVGITWPDTIKTSADGLVWVTRVKGGPKGNPLTAIAFAGQP